MRGQREKECLNTIIMSVFYDQNKKLIKDLKGKAYSEVSEEQFLQDYLFYTNIKYEYLFGLTQEDVKEIVNILRKWEPNRKPSEFPDFVFDNGFIEHFQITSSLETKKAHNKL